jgi:hypothetical protein
MIITINKKEVVFDRFFSFTRTIID